MSAAELGSGVATGTAVNANAPDSGGEYVIPHTVHNGKSWDWMVPVVWSHIVNNGVALDTATSAQVYESRKLSGLGRSIEIDTSPANVMLMVVGVANDTSDAVGRMPQVILVHVKLAAKESAWALGAPTAANSTIRPVHKDLRIFEIPLGVPR